jgi:hypothetical protein
VRRWRYRSGYTYLLFGETVRAGLVRAGRAAILHGDSTLWERSIKYHKCPTFDTKRRRFQTQLIDSPKQMIQIQRCR